VCRPALDEVCAGFDWRSRLDGKPKSWIQAAVGLTNYLRSPRTRGNQVGDGEEGLGDRKLYNQLARA
jgi:type I restriction enzyme R subunit